MNDWFPYRKANPDAELRLLCFHYAGGTAQVYRRFMHQQESVEVCAVQLPGREKRVKEPLLDNMADVIDTLFPILQPWLIPTSSDYKPYALVGHSMGTWLVYMLLAKIQHTQDAVLPVQVCLSAFPAPNLEQYRWNKNASMDDKQFQNELSRWGVNPLVFKPGYWPTFQKMLRKDFTLFDEFKAPATCPVFDDVPLTVFWATEDTMVPKDQVQAWEQLFPMCELVELEGAKHLFIQDQPKIKKEWETLVAERVLF